MRGAEIPGMHRIKRWSVVAVLAFSLALAACMPRPFADSSPWNTPIGAVGWRDAPQLRSGHSWVNLEAYSVPVAYGGGGDPVVAVAVPNSWGWPGGAVNVHIPEGVTGANGTDASLVVVDGSVVFNFLQFRRTGPWSATASSWAATYIYGSGWGRQSPFLGAGVRAAGASGFGGLITGSDLGGSDFRHALAVSLPSSSLSSGFVAPAIASDGGSGPIAMGARLGIPPGAPMPAGLSDMGVKMWNTLVRYGAYVVDTHGGPAPVVFSADPRSVGADRVNQLRNEGGDLDKIMPSVRVVQ
jgi:hypothetical protein